MFDTGEGYRHTCFITNTAAADDDATGRGDDIAVLELRHRGHARVEDRVRCWKACGLANLPFEDYVRNQGWVATSLIAGALLAWTRHAPTPAARRSHATPPPRRTHTATNGPG